jgi:hypothetical protein
LVSLFVGSAAATAAATAAVTVNRARREIVCVGRRGPKERFVGCSDEHAGQQTASLGLALQ